MEFGAHIFGVGELADPKTLVEVAQLAEELGYHSIFRVRILMPPSKTRGTR